MTPAPRLALGLGLLAVVLVGVVTGLQVTAVVLDETVYKLAAAQMADGSLGENTSRGVAKLYSLVVAPLFALFDGDVAVRLARSLNTVLFAAAALPTYALARRVAAPGPAAGAAVLSVAVPWLTLATIMFSESLAYLLFACALLAMVRVLETPSLGREAVVLGLLVALVLTRVQFVVLLVAWPLVLLARDRGAAPRRFRLTAAAVAVGLAGVVVLVVAGALTGRLREVAGPYYGLRDRSAVPGDFGLAVLWEVKMLALGVGVVPAMLAGAWGAAVLRRPSADRARELAVVGLAMVGALVAATVWAQGGFLDANSEERYFIYVVPLLWVAAAAALGTPEVRAGAIALWGLLLTAVMLLVPNTVGATGEQLFLGPASFALADLSPDIESALADLVGIERIVTARDLAGLITGLVALAAVLAWRRGTRLVALAPALVVQLALLAYVLAGVHGKLSSVDGITSGPPFAALGWVDRATSGGAEVSLLDSVADNRDGRERSVVFWNDEVVDVVRVGALGLPTPTFPLFTLPLPAVDVGDDLRVTGTLPRPLVVAHADSPLLQLAGDVTAREPGGPLVLLRPALPARATFLARGLDADGQVTRGVDLRIAGGHRLTLTVATPSANRGATVKAEIGGTAREVDFDEVARADLRFDLCDETGTVPGRLEAPRAAEIEGARFSAAKVVAARMERC